MVTERVERLLQVAPARPPQRHTHAWPISFVAAVALHPTQPSHVCALTASGAVFRSTNGAATWQAPGTAAVGVTRLSKHIAGLLICCSPTGDEVPLVLN